MDRWMRPTPVRPPGHSCHRVVGGGAGRWGATSTGSGTGARTTGTWSAASGSSAARRSAPPSSPATPSPSPPVRPWPRRFLDSDPFPPKGGFVQVRFAFAVCKQESEFMRKAERGAFAHQTHTDTHPHNTYKSTCIPHRTSTEIPLTPHSCL